MVGADDARFDDSHRAGRNARRGPAGTIRTRALDRLAPQRINAPWGEHRVDEQRLVAARALDIGGTAVMEESAERIHLVLCAEMGRGLFRERVGQFVYVLGGADSLKNST